MLGIGDMLFEIALHCGRYTHPLSLARHHAQVYSQNGEDGIISEIFRRIGAKDHFFVEIGIESGRQNNTRFLLESGWRGIWIDGNAEGVNQATSLFGSFIENGRLKIIHSFVTIENINDVLDEAGAPECFDFISIDVDQNTSHIWRAINRRSRAACIEYNSSVPPTVALQVPYDPAGRWDTSNWYGASLKALEILAAGKDMNLVGCELVGVDAFFVTSSDAKGRFQEPFTAEAHYEPPRYDLSRHTGHPPSPIARQWIEEAVAVPIQHFQITTKAPRDPPPLL